MKKLINGIVEFRRNAQKGYCDKFARLASGQKPDALFVACSDSRVVPNTFASTDPGDLFVLRNVGNFIPPCEHDHICTTDGSAAAAIEFSVFNLEVKDIVICGHSNCGAMQALVNDRNRVQTPELKNWLRLGEGALDRFRGGFTLNSALTEDDQLSQVNVLAQMEHVKSYPEVKKRIDQGELYVHGWWFDLQNADVYSYSQDQGQFVLLDEKEAERISALIS